MSRPIDKLNLSFYICLKLANIASAFLTNFLTLIFNAMQNKKDNAANVANATNSANQQANATNAVKTVIIGGKTIELTKQLEVNPFEAKAREAKKGIIWTIAEALKNSPEGLTKAEALTILVNCFDRPVKSLASTVNVQLPSRLSKDKGFIIKSVKGDDGQTRYFYKGQSEQTDK